LRQLPLKRAAMNAKEFCSLGDVARAIGEHALDMLPFYPRERRYGGRSLFLCGLVIEVTICGKDLIGVGGLTKVMICSQFQCLHRRGDASIAGEYDHSNCAVQFLDVLDEIKTVEIRHLRIQQDQVRTDAACKTVSLFLSFCLVSLATAI